MADISPDDARLQQLLVQGRQRAETAAADAAGADTNTLPISPILPPSSTPLSAGQNPVSDEQRLQQLIQEGNDRAKANAANVEAAGGFWPMVGSALGSGGRYVLGEAGSLAHGLGAGLAALPDVAGAATAGIANIPRRIENTFSAPDQQQPLIVAPTTFEDLYNRYVPPVKGYENSIGETVGRVAAPLILTGGAGTIPEIAAMGGRELAATGANLLGRAAVTAGGAAVGQDIGHGVGSLIDQATGGTAGRDYGDVIGSIIGGGAAPDLATYLGYHAASRALTDRPAGGPWRTPPGGGPPGGAAGAIPAVNPETSAARLAAADRLAATSGQGTAQDISLGRFGNRYARVLEDISTMPPFAGGPAYAARRAQLADMDRQALITANMIDPTRTNLPPNRIGPTTIGERALPVLDTATRNIQDQIDNLYDNGLHRVVPREAVVDPAEQHAILNALRNDPQVNQASQRATIDRLQADLRASSNQVLDPALEQQLNGAQASIMAQPQTPQTALALQNIAAQRLANRGPSFQAERTARAVNYANDPNFTPDNNIWQAIREAKTRAMRATAEREAPGVGGNLFDAAENRFSQLARQRDVLSNLRDEHGQPAKTAGAAYSSIFGASGIGNPEQAAALLEHNPIGARQLAADEYELRIRGNVSAGTPYANAETMAPKDAADWQAKQIHPATQALYTPTPAVAQRVADLAQLLRGETYRPTRAIPGRGGTSIGGSLATWSIPTFLGGLGGGLTSIGALPGTLAAALTPSALARFVGNRFTTQRFTRNVINPPTLGQSINLPRVLSSAVAGTVRR